MDETVNLHLILSGSYLRLVIISCFSKLFSSLYPIGKIILNNLRHVNHLKEKLFKELFMCVFEFYIFLVLKIVHAVY